MRNLILPAIAALSISLSSTGCLEEKLEADTHLQGIEITQESIEEGKILSQTLNLSSEGFSHFGVTAIDLAEIKVFKKYDLPQITYSERDYTNKLAAIADSTLCAEFPELPRSDTQDLFEVNTPYYYPPGQYLLIMENFARHQNDFFSNSCTLIGCDIEEKPMDERFSVPHLYPMVAQTIHNMGHIYFSMIGIEKQVDLAMCFQYLDYYMYEKTGEKITGHPSLLSHYSSIPWGDRVDARYALTNTDDQFAETFVYHVLNHTYKDDDELFQKRLEVVKESLELFAKN